MQATDRLPRKWENYCCNILGAPIQWLFWMATQCYLSADLSYCNHLCFSLPIFSSLSLASWSLETVIMGLHRGTESTKERKTKQSYSKSALWDVHNPLVGIWAPFFKPVFSSIQIPFKARDAPLLHPELLLNTERHQIHIFFIKVPDETWHL